MSREELLRETMARAASGGPPAGDAFLRFRAREKRAARWRFLVAVGSGVAALVALFMMLPGVGGEGSPGPGGTQGTRSPEPAIQRHYVDRLAKFELIFPDEWTGEKTEGSYVALFPRTRADRRYTESTFGPPAIETPLRFYVIVKVIDRARADARLADIDAQQRTGQVEVARGTRMFGARRADSRFLTYRSEEPPSGAEVADWCARCSMQEYLIAWPDDVVLDLRFVAPDAATLKAYAEEIEKLLGTVKYYGLEQK